MENRKALSSEFFGIVRNAKPGARIIGSDVGEMGQIISSLWAMDRNEDSC